MEIWEREIEDSLGNVVCREYFKSANDAITMNTASTKEEDILMPVMDDKFPFIHTIPDLYDNVRYEIKMIKMDGNNDFISFQLIKWGQRAKYIFDINISKLVSNADTGSSFKMAVIRPYNTDRSDPYIYNSFIIIADMYNASCNDIYRIVTPYDTSDIGDAAIPDLIFNNNSVYTNCMLSMLKNRYIDIEQCILYKSDVRSKLLDSIRISIRNSYRKSYGLFFKGDKNIPDNAVGIISIEEFPIL